MLRGRQADPEGRRACFRTLLDWIGSVMKSFFRKVICLAIQNYYFWTFLNATVLRLARYAERVGRWRWSWHGRYGYAFDTGELIRQISPQLIVRNGVFKDMRYPEMMAIGSSLAPKILGSYEREIHQVIESICTTNYSNIIDIGCAEGYYAVGLARRIKTARIYAFDTNKEALRLCREMARVNGVSDRIITGNYCDIDVLKSIPLVGRTLIISDCEGYEKYLFTEKSASFFRPHDLLIEIHDCVDINISSQIREVFQLTHDIESYESIDDIKKVKQYDFAELRAFDLATRKEILAERRATIMDWYYMKSRQTKNHP